MKPNPFVDYLMLVERLGRIPGAKKFLAGYHDAEFDDRMGMAIFVAANLGHEFAEENFDPDAPEPEKIPDLDKVCLICRRTLFVPVERPGIEGSAVEAMCPENVGSRAKN